MPPVDNQKRRLLCQLAVDVARVGSETEGYQKAAEACSLLFDRVVSMSISTLAQDGANLNHYKLYKASGSQQRQFVVTASGGSAAGTAMRYKEIVSTPNYLESQYVYTDWQLIHQDRGAIAFISAPLLVAGKAIGCLTIASTHLAAFEGNALFLVETLAAILAPLVGLQRLQSELQSVETVLKQVLPTRVAVRLADCQSRGGLSPGSSSQAGRENAASGPVGDVHIGYLFIFSDSKVERGFCNTLFRVEYFFLDVLMYLVVASSLIYLAWYESSEVQKRIGDICNNFIVSGVVVVAVAAYFSKTSRFVHSKEIHLVALRFLYIFLYVIVGSVYGMGNSGPVSRQLIFLPVVTSIASVLLQAVFVQVRLVVHVPVQWLACTVMVVGTTWFKALTHADLFFVISMQMLVGFVAPTLVLYHTENTKRLRFLVELAHKK